MPRAGQVLVAPRALAELLQVPGPSHRRRRRAEVRPRVGAQPAAAFPQHQAVRRLLGQAEVRPKERILLQGGRRRRRRTAQVPGKGQGSPIPEHGCRESKLFARLLQTFQRGAFEIAQQTGILDSRLA